MNFKESGLADASIPSAGEVGMAVSAQHLARLIYEIRDCAIYMLDPAGMVISWNPGAESMPSRM